MHRLQYLFCRKWLLRASEGRHRPNPSTQSVLMEFSLETAIRPGCAGPVCDSSPLGKHPAGNRWLEGGRSSLLKSAQRATLLSIAVLSFASQCNGLDKSRAYTCANGALKNGHSLDTMALRVYYVG